MTFEDFSSDTRELIVLLAKHQVRWVLIGGQAVIYHGHARLTGDTDIFFDHADAENLRRLLDALTEFWDGNLPRSQSYDALGTAGQLIQFGRPPNRINLLNSISGVCFEEVWKGADVVMSDLGVVRVIGIRELLKNKLAAARAKDLADADYLESRDDSIG